MIEITKRKKAGKSRRVVRKKSKSPKKVHARKKVGRTRPVKKVAHKRANSKHKKVASKKHGHKKVGRVKTKIAPTRVSKKHRHVKRKTTFGDATLEGNIFILGLILFIAALVLGNYYLVFFSIGVLFICVLSMENKKGKINLPTGWLKSSRSPEDRIIHDVNRILAKEKKLKAEEDKIKKEIEILYTKSMMLKDVVAKNTTSVPDRPNNELMDNEVKSVLKITDHLLGKLPESEIRKFMKTKDFVKYKRVMEKVR